MMIGRLGLISALSLLVGAISPAVAQEKPESPVHMTVNGIFYLCPKLVRSGTAPKAGELERLGFASIEARRSGELWFEGQGETGTLTVSYKAKAQQCMLNYAGKGYEQIAGIVRDIVVQNGMKRLTGGDKGGAKADVFEGTAPGTNKHVRIIIIENYTLPSAAISYSEKAGN